MKLASELKQSIFLAAISGQITEQLVSDSLVDDTLALMEKEKIGVVVKGKPGKDRIFLTLRTKKYHAKFLHPGDT